MNAAHTNRPSSGTPSWHDDHRLKADVLKQMQAHREQASLEPLRFAEDTVELYGWRAPLDPERLGDALGIPPTLLTIGNALWQGFPEDVDSSRDQVDLVRSFLVAIPVGRNLDEVVPRFLARWTSEPGWGLVGQTEGRFDGLFEDLALGVLGEPFDPQRLVAAKQSVEVGMKLAWEEHRRSARERGEHKGRDGRASFVQRSGRTHEWAVMARLDVGMAIARWEQEPSKLGRAIEQGLAADVEDAARGWLLAELGKLGG